MKTTLLYYPSFKIPAHEWLTDALLYWDEVGSIVPARMERGLNHPNIKYLTDEGCYRRFEPHPAFKSFSEEPSFEQELASRLDSSVFAQKLASDDSGQFWDLAFEKVTYRAWELLADRELTSTKHFTTSWIKVRRPAAIAYMGLLADRLARSDKSGYVKPSTDREDYEDIIFSNANLPNSQQGMSVKLLNLLPKASPDTELRTLLEFKAKRRDELEEFKRLLNHYRSQIVSCPDDATARLILDDFKQKIVPSGETIQRLFGENRIKGIVGTVRMIFATGGATWIADAGAKALGVSSHDPKVVAASLGLGLLAAGSIELAAYSLESKARHREIKESPYSYLYYANKEGVTRP